LYFCMQLVFYCFTFSKWFSQWDQKNKCLFFIFVYNCFFRCGCVHFSLFFIA
jgi:hypothetical protein